MVSLTAPINEQRSSSLGGVEQDEEKSAGSPLIVWITIPMERHGSMFQREKPIKSEWFRSTKRPQVQSEPFKHCAKENEDLLTQKLV